MLIDVMIGLINVTSLPKNLEIGQILTSRLYELGVPRIQRDNIACFAIETQKG